VGGAQELIPVPERGVSPGAAGHGAVLP
jgi:hypothetical protein